MLQLLILPVACRLRGEGASLGLMFYTNDILYYVFMCFRTLHKIYINDHGLSHFRGIEARPLDVLKLEVIHLPLSLVFHSIRSSC